MNELLELLKKLKENPQNINVYYGICYNIQLRFRGSELEKIFYNLCKKWPKFSGDKSFPVPSPNLLCEGDYYFYCYYSNVDMWDKETEYGRLRWELLDFLIDELEKCDERNGIVE